MDRLHLFGDGIFDDFRFIADFIHYVVILFEEVVIEQLFLDIA
jgi:hypothetical protein